MARPLNLLTREYETGVLSTRLKRAMLSVWTWEKRETYFMVFTSAEGKKKTQDTN
jgi:hypothetical protein